MNIKEYLLKLGQKQITCVDFIKECISNIKKFDQGEAKINAVITLNEKEALEQAKEVDKRLKNNEALRKLEGVPIAIKDVYCVKGMRTTASAKILDNYYPPYTATAVERLLKEGAIIIAKTNCDAFAHGASGENSDYGPTKNPFDLERVPGGSSSGSAAILKYGGALAALGTDTGGSIRCPASYCGLTGLKPTFGRVSRFGLIAMCSSTDTVSPIAQNSEEIAMLMEIISGKDEKDATAQSFEGKDFTRDFHLGVRGLRVGYIKESVGEGLDPRVKEIFNASLKKLSDNGAFIDEISLPLFGEPAVATYYIITPSEVSSNLAKFDGIKYGMTAQEAINLEEVYLKSRSKYLGAEAKRRIMLGNFALSSGFYDEYYNKAQKVRALMKEEAKSAFEKFDILATPTMATPPFKFGEKEDPLAMYLADIDLSYASLTNICAVSTNAGWIKNDNPNAISVVKEHSGQLPIGIQFMAKWWDEETLLRLSYSFENII